MSEPKPTLIYTRVDEAPALATWSLLPIIEAFAGAAGIDVTTRDISLAGRILAQFPERLRDDQRIGDDLTYLGELAKTPAANIVKLPNISASMPQLEAAIRELQSQGYDLPDYPYEPRSDEERDVKERYDRVKGSAVNPVLREGNSDRRAPDSVKAYARAHPHSMGAWSSESKSHVATMQDGDLRHSEVSTTVQKAQAGEARIEHVAADGTVTALKAGLALQPGRSHRRRHHEPTRAPLLPRRAGRGCEAQDVLFSVHLKATNDEGQ
jgi:Monomeric isocitrate dehydrogenase